jgi:predicted negative regulator of RcsB-dependent stress response
MMFFIMFLSCTYFSEVFASGNESKVPVSDSSRKTQTLTKKEIKDRINVVFNLAMNKWGMKQYTTALTFIDQAISFTDQLGSSGRIHKSEMIFTKIQILLDNRDHMEGENLFKELHAMNIIPKKALSYLEGRIQLEKGDQQLAEKCLKEAISWNGELRHISISGLLKNIQAPLGRALLNQDKLDEALPYLEAARASGHEDANADFGYLLVKKGKRDQGESIIRKYANQGDPLSKTRLAELLCEEGRYQEAISILQDVTSQSNQSRFMKLNRFFLGRVFAQVGLFEEAVSLLLTLAQEPDFHGKVNYVLGDIYLQTKNFESALSAFIESAKQGYIRSNLRLGMLYYDQKNYDLAHSFFAQAAKSKDNYEALMNQGNILILNQDYRKAKDVFAILANKGLVAAKVRLVATHYLLGEIDQAIKLMQKVIHKDHDDSFENIETMTFLLREGKHSEEEILSYETYFLRRAKTALLVNSPTAEVKNTSVSNSSSSLFGLSVEQNVNLKKYYPRVAEKETQLEESPVSREKTPSVAARPKTEHTSYKTAEELLGGNSKHYEVFYRFFLPLIGDVRIGSLEISREDAENLIKKLGGMPESGKGRHRKITFMALSDSNAELEDESPFLIAPERMYILSSQYLKPYQILGLREIFLERRLYPKELESLLVEKGLLKL